jgi:hypothetical protein
MARPDPVVGKRVAGGAAGVELLAAPCVRTCRRSGGERKGGGESESLHF